MNEYHEMKDFEGFNIEVLRVLSIEPPVDENGFVELKQQELIEQLNMARQVFSMTLPTKPSAMNLN